ncbi:MAG TPA: hypothetical protein VK603_02055 [Candidatus Saccharimonadales bacterium]|nr:hypothetical protein [Candidatus Saccharimonadales bacterium]
MPVALPVIEGEFCPPLHPKRYAATTRENKATSKGADDELALTRSVRIRRIDTAAQNPALYHATTGRLFVCG